MVISYKKGPLVRSPTTRYWKGTKFSSPWLRTTWTIHWADPPRSSPESERMSSFFKGTIWKFGKFNDSNHPGFQVRNGHLDLEGKIAASLYKVGPGCSYKWSYNPYKWPYKWLTVLITLVIGVLNPVITGRGPTLYYQWGFLVSFHPRAEPRWLII